MNFKNINLLKQTESGYEIVKVDNVYVEIPDLVLQFKQKYDIEELVHNKTKLISIIEERKNAIYNAIDYLLEEPNFDILLFDTYLNDLDDIKLASVIERYNLILLKEYNTNTLYSNNNDISSRDKYLIEKYKILEPSSFFNKEYIDSEDFTLAYLNSFIFDYNHCTFFLNEVISFFNNLVSSEDKKNNFFSFLFYQYEYYFFLYTLDYSLCDRICTKFKKNTSFIDTNVSFTSMLLNFSFSKSSKGLYHSSSDLSDSFLGFLELHIRDLYSIINDPTVNVFHFLNYLKNKYGLVIYPFCILNTRGQLTFNTFDNMVDFSYLEDFVNSYLRLMLNMNTTCLYNTVSSIKNELV